LLVVTTSDAEDVTLEFITKSIAGYFLGHTLIVETTAIEFISLFCSQTQIQIRTYRRRSSSISINFWQPVAGFAMLS
jgi:hypothetical protein